MKPRLAMADSIACLEQPMWAVHSRRARTTKTQGLGLSEQVGVQVGLAWARRAMTFDVPQAR